jgi:hypothetical protein
MAARGPDYWRLSACAATKRPARGGHTCRPDGRSTPGCCQAPAHLSPGHNRFERGRGLAAALASAMDIWVHARRRSGLCARNCASADDRSTRSAPPGRSCAIVCPNLAVRRSGGGRPAVRRWPSGRPAVAVRPSGGPAVAVRRWPSGGGRPAVAVRPSGGGRPAAAVRRRPSGGRRSGPARLHIPTPIAADGAPSRPDATSGPPLGGRAAS